MADITVHSMKVVTADRDLLYADRHTDQDLFRATVGGYGGIALIVECTLRISHNFPIQRRTITTTCSKIT